MKWTAKPTGDMTLSVIDENGFQLLKVDMLNAGTMKAGTDGSILCRTLNDLSLIASFAENQYSTLEDILPYPEEGISPIPWLVSYDEAKRLLKVKSAKRTIASKNYPRSVSDDLIQSVLQAIQLGITQLNQQEHK